MSPMFMYIRGKGVYKGWKERRNKKREREKKKR